MSNHPWHKLVHSWYILSTGCKIIVTCCFKQNHKSKLPYISHTLRRPADRTGSGGGAPPDRSGRPPAPPPAILYVFFTSVVYISIDFDIVWYILLYVVIFRYILLYMLIYFATLPVVPFCTSFFFRCSCGPLLPGIGGGTCGCWRHSVLRHEVYYSQPAKHISQCIQIRIV